MVDPRELTVRSLAEMLAKAIGGWSQVGQSPVMNVIAAKKNVESEDEVQELKTAAHRIDRRLKAAQWALRLASVAALFAIAFGVGFVLLYLYGRPFSGWAPPQDTRAAATWAVVGVLGVVLEVWCTDASRANRARSQIVQFCISWLENYKPAHAR
jgi:hypothetical protein